MKRVMMAMLVVMVAGLSSAGVRAEVPFLIPVVGVLTDTDDVPLDGTYDVVFTMYTAQTGGQVLAGETHEGLVFTDGLFRTYLGSESLGGLDVVDFVENEEVWLGMRVGSDNEMNRVRLAAVPWAFEAETCGQVTDLSAAGIQGAIGADACGANQALRGWSGSAAQCVDLPDVSSLVENSDIGVTVQAPIDQANFPCNYGVQQISASGTVVCANQAVVTQCGPEAGLGSNDNYLGSDGACHKAPHSCGDDQYLAGDGTCRDPYDPQPLQDSIDDLDARIDVLEAHSHAGLIVAMGDWFLQNGGTATFTGYTSADSVCMISRIDVNSVGAKCQAYVSSGQWVGYTEGTVMCNVRCIRWSAS